MPGTPIEMEKEMEIRIVRNVLEKNKKLADNVREKLHAKGATMFNFMSSPGSGKTTLFQRLVPALKDRGLRIGIIEGDVTTAIDAERLNHLGVPISLINTEKFGGTCHLAANVVLGALETLDDMPLDMILIENVGNLICPGEYDTGADGSLVLLSVTEGEDKPLKYPAIFRKTDASVISKIDVAGVLECDVGLLRENILRANPAHTVFEASGKTGAGVSDLADYLVGRHQASLAARSGAR